MPHPPSFFLQWITQWDFQNKGKSGWTGTSSFVLEVPLRNLRPSVIKDTTKVRGWGGLMRLLAPQKLMEVRGWLEVEEEGGGGGRGEGVSFGDSESQVKGGGYRKRQLFLSLLLDPKQ